MTHDELRDSRILVTGGTGFLGRHLLRTLKEEYGCDRLWSCCVSAVPRHHPAGLTVSGVDLTDPDEADVAFELSKPDLVFHLAGYNGGLGFNVANPFEIYRANTAMALNVLDCCARFRVKKVVSVVASCGSDSTKHLLEPADFLRGQPHPTVAGHGWAKRNLQLASRLAREQHGLNAVCAMPTTVYGPGDSFDSARTKVVGAMVKRFCDAVADGLESVTCWGTGRPYRDLLHVEDCARLLAQTMLHYEDGGLPIHLGFEQEFSVKEVAEAAARAVVFKGAIVWDESKPDGQFRKRLLTDDTWKVLTRFAPTPFEEGLARAVADYRAREQGGVVAA